MLKIEKTDRADKKYSDFIDREFEGYADKNGIVCNYENFSFAAIKDGEIVGAVSGHSYYGEAHISELIVLEKYRNMKIGTELLEAVEKYCKEKGFENINLTSYEFQAPRFYEKNGFTVEYVRKNEKEPRLTKYFLIKRI